MYYGQRVLLVSRKTFNVGNLKDLFSVNYEGHLMWHGFRIIIYDFFMDNTDVATIADIDYISILQ